jgi:lipopolysaccharide/colanic/teichoic acid biosynthesis glycosyltransferase
VECFVQHYTAAQRRILAGRPGLASVSALAYHDEADLLQAAADPEAMYISELMPRKLALDIRYEHDRTLRSDLKLLGEMACFVALGSRRR